MSDYRLMFDHQVLKALHLQGREHTVVIASVKPGAITGEGGKSDRMPIVAFEGKTLPFGLNKTNARTLAQAFGVDTRAWVGQTVTLFPTTTKFGKDTVDCIRLRVPRSAPTATSGAAPASEPEPGDADERGAA